jgi:DNA-binding NarL/FixJ family response regulator
VTLIRVLLVDDHPITLMGMRMLIDHTADMRVCGEAGGATAALDILAEARPTVAVVDLTLGKDSGLELIGRLRTLREDLPVLVHSMHDERVFAERCLHAGASGYVMKGEPTDTLLSAIRQVVRGGIFVSPAISDLVLRRLTVQTKSELQGPAKLSDRQIEVFRMVGRGMSTREIAASLFISVKTVESHRATIKERLGLKTAAEMVVAAAHWTAKEEDGVTP